jgi:hypothetical protein
MKSLLSTARDARPYAPRILSAAVLALLVHGEAAPATFTEPAATFYVAKMSSAPGWEDVMFDPIGSGYVGTYLAAGALSAKYAELRKGAWRIEAEGQVVRYFGDQDHWELNAVPVIARWQRFPWSRRLAMSAAFGIGVSYATELPQIEVQLEGETSRFLVYWVMELTAGPRDGRWAASLRLHHRSVAYGLLGEEGGMNAVGLGLRYSF